MYFIKTWFISCFGNCFAKKNCSCCIVWMVGWGNWICKVLNI